MKTIQQFAKLIHLATDHDSRKAVAELFEAAKADFDVYQQNAGLIQRIVADVADVKAVYLASQPEIELTRQAFRDLEPVIAELVGK
jgi:hypothetical protein